MTKLIPIAVCYAIIFWVGIVANKKFSQGTGKAGLFLASRQVPLILGIFTMTATWVGGGYINGTAEAVYASGALWAQAPWGYAIALVLGGLIFAAPMRKRGYVTMLDPFKERYGDKMAALLFIPALVGEVFWSAAILTALGSTFGIIMGVDIETAILVSAIVAILYTAAGGFWSVVYTDLVQLVFILLGLGIALPYVLDNVNGLDALYAAYQTEFANQASFFPSANDWVGQGPLGTGIWVWCDFALLLMLGGIPWQVYFQRVLSSKNEKTAVYLSIYAAVGCLLFAIPPVLIGMVGAVVDWQALGLGGPESSAIVLPYVILHLTPEWVSVLVLAAVAAAVMSSVDSSILSVTTMGVNNLYLPFIRPQASDEELRWILRLGVIGVGALATLLALQVQSVYALWYLCADFVYCILFPQLFLVLFFKQAHAMGALAGVACALVLRLGGGEPILGIPSFIEYPLTDASGSSVFPFKTFSMLVNFVVTIMVSYAVLWMSSARGIAGGSSIQKSVSR